MKTSIRTGNLDGIHFVNAAAKDDHAALARVAAMNVGKVLGKQLSDAAIEGLSSLKTDTLEELAGVQASGEPSTEPAQPESKWPTDQPTANSAKTPRERRIEHQHKGAADLLQQAHPTNHPVSPATGDLSRRF